MKRGGAVPVRQNNSECLKLAAEKRERREKTEALMHKLLSHYDVNQSGRLETSELTYLLRDYSEATFDRQEEPCREDMDFILFMCDEDDSGSIERKELWKAIDIWFSFVDQRPKMQELFRKYDTDGSCQIDQAELSEILKELNGDVAVEMEVVTWMMAMADVTGDGTLCAPELSRAVAAWWANVGGEPNSTGRSRSCTLL